MLQTELFQDDLFPPTHVLWKPALTSSEWFSGKNKAPQRISLRPEGMDLCEYMKLIKFLFLTFS